MDVEIFIRFLLAALWGGMVGAEREYRSKSAGLRTMMLISLGACFFTIISAVIGRENPDRIAANIVTGVGFLGAGVIFRGAHKVDGITTAATIWAVAAVGMGIGSGYYFASAAGSLMILIVLAILPYAEQQLDLWHQTRSYQIRCLHEHAVVDRYEAIFKKQQLDFRLQQITREGNQLRLVWQVRGRAAAHNRLVKELLADANTQSFGN